jgi:2',3'-cyclic-nucleotide 2'-phosphodiesterase (5'-nucleotidase family)
MEYSLDLMGATKGGFLQFSGMTVTYDPDGASGEKVVSIKVNGAEVDKDATYSIATIDFIASGGDGNTFLEDYTFSMNKGLDTIMIDYISGVGTITEDMIEGGRLIAA